MAIVTNCGRIDRKNAIQYV